MDYLLIGIIVLISLAQVGLMILCVNTFRSITESQTKSWERRFDSAHSDFKIERRMWQTQIEVLLNRSQFPEIALNQTVTRVGEEVKPESAKYVDDNRELELEEEQNAVTAA